MTDTISFLPQLDMASDSRKANLCRSWKNAVMNKYGVYVDNRIDIDKYKTKNRVFPRITIHCALEYPKVYYSFDVMGENRGGGGFPGKGSSNFDVHEHEANVVLMVEQALRKKITDDHKIPEKMIREVIEDFKAAIVSDDNELKKYTQECAVCKRMIPKEEIFEDEGKEVCMDCWEKETFTDDEE